MNGRYSARKGYLDIFTKSGERTRCWNRTDRTIRPIRAKALRVARAEAPSIRQLVQSVPDANRLRIGRVSLDDIERALRPKKHIDPKNKLPKHY